MARVFELAADIPAAVGRIRGIDTIEILEPAPAAPDNIGPVGLGFRWRETRTMMGKQATEDMAITEWSRPDAYVAEARSYGSHYRTTFVFASSAPDVTRVTATFVGTPETLAAKVFWALCFFMNKAVAKCIREDLQDIKAAAESAGEHPWPLPGVAMPEPAPSPAAGGAG